MSGVLDNGIQYERCNECGAYVDIRDLEYERPSGEYPHGRDLCAECANGCAYARGDADTRDGCTCAVCEASRYYRPMTDAIGAVTEEIRAARAARDARDADPLVTARQDADVAIAAARETELNAIADAARRRARDEVNAETCYRAACQRAANEENRIRDMIIMFGSLDTPGLLRMLQMESFRLARATGRMRAAQQEDSSVKVREITRVLERRGVEIPTWRFQKRAVRS